MEAADVAERVSATDDHRRLARMKERRHVPRSPFDGTDSYLGEERLDDPFGIEERLRAVLAEQAALRDRAEEQTGDRRTLADLVVSPKDAADLERANPALALPTVVRG